MACQSRCLSSRMYTVTMPWPTTPSHYCLQDIKCVFPFSCVTFFNGVKPCLCFYFCNQSFIWTTKAWNGDGRHNWQAISTPSVCGTPLHRQNNRLNTSIRVDFCSVNTHLRKNSDFWVNWTQTQTHTSALRCTVEHLAVVIQMLAWHHLSQQHITSTLLTFTHNVYFRFVICCFFSYWT